MSSGKAKLKPDSQDFIYYDTAEKTATKAAGGKGAVSGKLYLPKEWIGKKVLCLLLEEPDDTKSEK